MACIGEYNDGETLERRHNSSPLEYPYDTSVRHCIPLSKMENYQYYKVADRYQSYYTGVFKGVKATQERKWDDNKPVEYVSIIRPEDNRRQT